MCNKSSTTIIIQLIIRTNRHVSKTKKIITGIDKPHSPNRISCAPKGVTTRR